MYNTAIVNTAPPVSWRFIDRQTYAMLKNNRHALSIDKFKDMFEPGSALQARLSETTRVYLKRLNETLNYVFFGTAGLVCPGSHQTDSEAVKDQIRQYLQECSDTNASFYEILSIDNESFLVVVDSGFLYHLTQSKDTLVEYVLACLGCLDRFKCESSQLNELYLRLLFIKGYDLLIGVRVQS